MPLAEPLSRTVELADESRLGPPERLRLPSLLLGLAVASSLAFFVTRAFSPWHWMYDENGALFGYIGSNYLRHSLTATRGGMNHWTNFAGPSRALEFYSTHPPLLGWLCGVLQWLFGIRPLAVRLVPALAQLGSLVPLYLIGRRLFGRAPAAWGTLVYALLPMTAYFGYMVNFEPVANLFVLLAVYCYVRLSDDGWSARWAAALAASLLAGMWTDWPAYFAAMAIGADWFFTGRGWSRLRAAVPCSAGLVAFGLFACFIYQLGGTGSGGIGSLLNAFRNRAGVSPDAQYSLGDFLMFLAEHNLQLYGLGLVFLVASLFGLASRRTVRPVAVLWAVAVLNVAVFSFGAATHEYWTYYFAPPAAIGAMLLAPRGSGEPLVRDTQFVVACVAQFVVAFVLAVQSVAVIDDYNSPGYARYYDYHRRAGELISDRAKPDEVVMMSFGWCEGAATGYYAGRPMLRIESAEELAEVRQHPEFPGGYLIADWSFYPSGGEALLESFERVAELEVYGYRVDILHVPPARPVSSGVADDPLESADFLATAARPRPAGFLPDRGDCRWPGCSRPNVLLVLLESTGPQYCQAFGAPLATTPNLCRLQQHAATFDRFYAHGAVSSRALFSIFCGVYPGPQREMETNVCPAVDLPSLPDLFRRAGYRTAFLNSTQLSFQSNEPFLAARGFDRVIDVDELGTRHPFVNWPDYYDWYDVVDDRVLAPEALRLIDDSPDEPFFITVYTYMAHWPYYPTAEPRDFLPGEELELGSFEAYLNTLRNQDQMLGDLTRGLADRGLTDSTIVVVTADHGEEFGQHGGGVHGEWLYDEVLHVPLVISNPVIFPRPVRSSALGEHLDLAPTLAELAGLAIPPEWQGTSLFAAERRPRTYHVLTPPDQTAVVLGLHEGRFKYVYAPQHRIEQLFDLVTDPGERLNLAARPEYASTVARLRRRAQSWAEFQAGYLQRFWDRSRLR